MKKTIYQSSFTSTVSRKILPFLLNIFVSVAVSIFPRIRWSLRICLPFITTLKSGRNLNVSIQTPISFLQPASSCALSIWFRSASASDSVWENRLRDRSSSFFSRESFRTSRWLLMRILYCHQNTRVYGLTSAIRSRFPLALISLIKLIQQWTSIQLTFLISLVKDYKHFEFVNWTCNK